jgi:transcriptional regulator with PAS, ATPase and Fis domain
VNREEAFLAEEKTLRQYTCDIISLAMKKHHNNIALVAEKLGIGKSTIYQLIQKKEINL